MAPGGGWQHPRRGNDAPAAAAVARVAVAPLIALLVALPQPWTRRHRFMDHLVPSVTNSASFAPAETLPLSTRMTMLTSVEAMLSLPVVLIVAARAIAIVR